MNYKIPILLTGVFIFILMIPSLINAYHESKDNDWWTSTHCVFMNGTITERYGYDLCDSSQGVFRAEFGIPEEYIEEVYISKESYYNWDEHWHMKRVELNDALLGEPVT